MENDEQIGSLKRSEQKKWHARTVGLVGRCAQWSRHGAVQLRRDKSEMQFYLAQHTRFTRLGTRVRRRVTAFDMARSVLCVHLLYRKSLRDVLLPSALRKRKPTTARRRGAAPCPAAARCVHGNWNSYTVAAQPMGSSCKPFPLPGPAALGGVFTSPDRPTDRPTDPPEAVRAEGRRWMAALPLPQPRHIGGVGRAVGIGPPQPPRPIPAHPSLHHRRCSPSPSAGTAKGAVAASARTNVLAMQAECRSTNRPTRLPNQPAKHDRECSRPEGGSPPQSKVRRSVPRSGFMRITLRKAGAQGPPSYVRPECRPCHH